MVLSKSLPIALLFLLSLGTAGANTPAKPTLPILPAPILTHVTKNAAGQFVLGWNLVPGAFRYEIERATSPIGADKKGAWEEIVNPVLTDKDIPWTDKDSVQFNSSTDPMQHIRDLMTGRPGIWYHIRVFNFDGVPSPWSADYEARKPGPKWTGLDAISEKRMFHGQPVPPPAVPAAPVVTLWSSSLSHPSQGSITWRGVTGGVRYALERSVTGPNGPWVVLCDWTTTANDTTWPDQPPQRQSTSGPAPHPYAWYRVKAYNTAGQSGPYSPVFKVDLSPAFTMKF